MVGTVADVDGARQLDGEKAARAGGVAQHVGEVGGGDERAEARHHLDMLAIRTLGLHHGQRQHVLQEALLYLRRDLVELVEVDEQHLRHHQQHLLLLRGLGRLRVAPLQLRRQQRLTERRLVPALLRDEQGYGRVAIARVLGGAPLADHRQEPRVEPLLPVGVPGGHGAGQLTDAVTAVPFAATLPQILPDGRVAGCIAGVDVALHILVPHVETFGTGLQGQVVGNTLVDRLPRVVRRVVGPVFGIAHHRVIT